VISGFTKEASFQAPTCLATITQPSNKDNSIHLSLLQNADQASFRECATEGLDLVDTTDMPQTTIGVSRSWPALV
jgi:hypothetical protein